MKKMNRSQSSYRPKTIHNDDSDSWLTRVPNKQPSKQSMVNSYLEENKQNNSLFQSISERNFVRADLEIGPSTDLIRDSVTQQLRDKCRRLQQELNRQYAEGGKSQYRYSEKYYIQEIQALKKTIRHKDQELEMYQQERFSRNQEMDSISSQFSTKMDKEHRDKNLYIKQINQKAIEIAHLQERVKYQRQQIDTLKLCLEGREKDNKELQEKVGQTDMKKKKIQYYEGQLKDRQEMLRQIEARVQAFKQQTDEKDLVIRDKSEQVEKLEQTLGSYDDKLKSIEQRLLSLREEKKTAQEHKEEAMRECQEWKQSYQDLLQQNDSHHENELKLKTYQGMVEDLNKRCLQLTSSNEKLRIASNNHQKIALRLQQSQKEVAQLRKDFQNRQERIYQLQAKEKAYKHLEQSHEKAKKEKDDYFLKLQEKSKESKLLTSQLEQRQLRVAELEQQLAEIGESCLKTKEREENMETLRRQNSRLSNDIQQKVNERERLQLKICNLQNKLSDKQGQYQKLRAAYDQKEQQVNEKGLEVDNLRERLTLESSSRMMSEEKVLKCTQEILTLKDNLSKTEGKVEELCEQLQEAKADYKKEIVGLRQSIIEINFDREKTEKMMSQYKAQTDRLSKDIEGHRMDLEECSRKERDHKERLSALQSMLQEATKQISQLRTQKSQIINKCSQLKSIYDFVQGFREE